MKQITLEEYNKSNWCLENPWDMERLVEDYNDLFDYISPNKEDDLNAIEEAKEILVYEKNYYQLDPQDIIDYLDEEVSPKQLTDLIIINTDNWNMDYFDELPQRLDIIDKMVEELNGLMDSSIPSIKRDNIIYKYVEEYNKAQTWYTCGKILGYLDLSKEVKEYIECK